MARSFSHIAGIFIMSGAENGATFTYVGNRMADCTPGNKRRTSLMDNILAVRSQV